MVTVTVEFASAVPEIAGVAEPTVDPSAGARITGATGGVASTVKFTAADGTDGVPLTVCTAVALWAPSLSGVGTGSCHVPPALAVVVPIEAPSMNTSTVAFGSEVPWTVGLAFVVEPSAGCVMTGGAGGQSMPPAGAVAAAWRGSTSTDTDVTAGSGAAGSRTSTVSSATDADAEVAVVEEVGV